MINRELLIATLAPLALCNPMVIAGPRIWKLMPERRRTLPILPTLAWLQSTWSLSPESTTHTDLTKKNVNRCLSILPQLNKRFEIIEYY